MGTGIGMEMGTGWADMYISFPISIPNLKSRVLPIPVPS